MNSYNPRIYPANPSYSTSYAVYLNSFDGSTYILGTVSSVLYLYRFDAEDRQTSATVVKTNFNSSSTSPLILGANEDCVVGIVENTIFYSVNKGLSISVLSTPGATAYNYSTTCASGINYIHLFILYEVYRSNYYEITVHTFIISKSTIRTLNTLMYTTRGSDKWGKTTVSFLDRDDCFLAVEAYEINSTSEGKIVFAVYSDTASAINISLSAIPLKANDIIAANLFGRQVSCVKLHNLYYAIYGNAVYRVQPDSRNMYAVLNDVGINGLHDSQCGSGVNISANVAIIPVGQAYTSGRSDGYVIFDSVRNKVVPLINSSTAGQYFNNLASYGSRFLSVSACTYFSNIYFRVPSFNNIYTPSVAYIKT